MNATQPLNSDGEMVARTLTCVTPDGRTITLTTGHVGEFADDAWLLLPGTALPGLGAVGNALLRPAYLVGASRAEREVCGFWLYRAGHLDAPPAPVEFHLVEGLWAHVLSVRDNGLSDGYTTQDHEAAVRLRDQKGM